MTASVEIAIRSSESMAAFAAAAEQPPRERPILFSGEMVRAILGGRKSQTRRVVKPQPPAECGDESNRIMLHDWGNCPYGNVGDRLWVREAWGTVTWHEFGQHIYGGRRIPDREEVVYRAGKQMGTPIPGTRPMQFRTEWHDDFQPARWRPSIHMPRWASRLTLEVTEVRVERLGAITELDAIAEGCFDEKEHDGSLPTSIFFQLWDDLNEKRGYGSTTDPWVWVIGFRRLLSTGLRAAAGLPAPDTRSEEDQ